MSRVSALSDGSPFAPGRPYPERAERETARLDTVARWLHNATIRPLRERFGGFKETLSRVVALAASHEPALKALSDDDLRGRALSMRSTLRQHGFVPRIAAECFAIVREAAVRTLGQRHYDVQVMAGYALLSGRIAEMATGEGKTFAATLPACTVALAGYPVHVITVNDYLAQRDAEVMSPLYEFLDLTVGTVVQGMERPARRVAYAQSVTYCTNKELAFDYLRDRVAHDGRSSGLHLELRRLQSERAGEDLVLRGLCYAIVDEADSVFIDEARTPLILSAGAGDAAAAAAADCQDALAFAELLIAGVDFAMDSFERRLQLLEPGHRKLDAYAGERDGIWASKAAREELIGQALSALHLYQRDQHYVVADDKVQIVDEYTGRVMPDRSWEHGLHQLIEAKEGCPLTVRRHTIARLTYQRLFSRYVRISGMSGTAVEVAGEIRSVYHLGIARIPLNRPLRRVNLPEIMCATLEEKWCCVADSVETIAGRDGRPVLIGTRSVRASEELSQVLQARGIAHTLLNAKQDAQEAEVVARAGEAGCVTVATNMAGRGTDIKLGDGVAEKGGLHVILTEYHESQRIDRQLFGRAGRQGDPGSCQAIISLEDELFDVCAPTASASLRLVRKRGVPVPRQAYAALRMLAQRSAEGRNVQMRKQTLKHDRRLTQVLAFCGKGE